LHEVIAIGAIDATAMPVVLVLLAAIATTSFHVIIARTLTILVALESFGAALVAFAWLAALAGESVEIVLALIAPLTHYTWSAVTLARVAIAGGVVAAHRIAQAVLAAIARSDVEVARLALSAIPSNYIRLALALTSDLVTSRDTLFILLGSSLVATAAITASMRQGQRITKVSGQTLITMLSGCIVDAF